MFSFRRLFFAVVFIITLIGGAGSLVAQTLSSNRWLLIVNTSVEMQRRQVGTLAMVQGLLLTGMNGQLRRGDTIGLWTFNDSLHTGIYPLQMWRPETRELLATRTVEFLKEQPYGKSARFDKVIPQINELVTNSDIVTIILLTDGLEEIHGTPYDEVFNNTFKQDARYQKNLREPFVVVLRGEGGRLVDYAITFAPWLPKFPALPPMLVAEISQSNPPPSPEKLKPPVPPLMLSGKKPDATNAAVPFVPLTESPPVVTLNTGPLVTLTNPSVAEAISAEKASSNSDGVPPLEKPKTLVPPVMPVVEPPPVIQELPKIPDIPAVDTSRVATQVVTPPYEVSIERKPTTAIILPPLVDENVPPTKTSLTQAPAPARVREAPPTPPAGAVPVEAKSDDRPRLFIGIALVMAAIVAGVLWLRRSRPSPDGSLITRSLDKDRNK